MVKQALLAGEVSKAQELLAAPIFYKTKNPEYYFLLGRTNQELRKNYDALISYSYAIALDSGNFNAYINRALTRGALNDLKGALEDLDAADQLSPNNPIIYMNRAVTYAGLNKLALAIQDFNRAISLNPNYADAYRNRGIVKNYLSDRKSACADWSVAAKRGDQEAGSWVLSLCPKFPRGK